MARNHIGIQVYGHFIQLQLGKPESVYGWEQLVVTFLVELPEEPAEGALAGHSFVPAKYATDHLIMAKGSGMGKPGGSQNGTDHKPFSKIDSAIFSVGSW
jgi:hypothetical protein